MKSVIIFLIISDILILSAFGLINPIFGIFLKEGISGGSIAAAGIASTIFFLVKSITQLPLSYYIDKKRNKLGFLFLGTFIVVLVPLFYAFSPNIRFIFISQAAYGIGAAMAYPAWFSLFTMHLDRKHRGLEWSIWSTGVGVGIAITAYIGAKIAEVWGFQKVFFLVSVVSFIGMLVLFFISKRYLKDVEKVEHYLVNGFHKK